jgi:hypothetical protein
MLSHNPQTNFSSATLLKPKERQHTAGAGDAQDEIHCTLCDCAEFRRSRVATVCTCGHHYEDHEIPDSLKGGPSRF